MAVQEVSNKLLGQLEEMGFPLPQATRALHYSGNVSVEDAIHWIIEHENDPDINEMPPVAVDIDIETSEPFHVSDQVRLKAEELRNRARIKKEEEEKKLEREGEKERIRSGKQMLEAKRIAEENERKRSLALREAERDEERKAREKIREKLQQDKLQRRSRLGLPAPQDQVYIKPAMNSMQEKKSASLPVKFTTKVELMTKCLRSLKRQHKGEDAKVRRAFQTLQIYIRNIANNPDEGKFRKIRFRNPLFQERVGIFKEGIDFLELCGFERVDGGEFLVLPKEKVDMALLRSAGNILLNALTNPFFGLLST